jgi:hypothetical protein
MRGFRTERVLARTFFGRFFESDVMPAVPQAQLVIWSLAVLAAPGFMMALQLGRAYARASNSSRASLFDAIMRDQLLYVTYSMIALGFVALLMWEGVFPDRRDARILDVLPISTRTHVAGRLAALGAFAVLFSVGINVPSAVAYGIVLFVYEAAAGQVRIVAAHLIATAMAGFFAFFLLILAQGVLLNVAGRTMARRLALALQSVFVVVLLQALIFAPFIASVVAAAFRSDQPSIGVSLPLAWFLAFYDVLAGTRRSVHGTMALAAVVATATVVVMGTALIALSYRRLVRIALETPDGGGDGRTKLLGLFGLSSRASRALAGVLRPGPVQRAVAGFTLRSLGRSRTHLMLLATYVGAAVAIVVSTLIPLVASGKLLAFETPSVVLLSVPLVFYFFVLVGMRALFGIPIEIKANWVFRLHAPEDRIHAAVAGARLALLLAVVAPIAIAAGLLGMALWGARDGAIHLAFTAALGMLLVDVLLIGLRKIPFACTYYPGRSRAPTLWPLFVVAFVVYAYVLAGTESAAMKNRLLLGVFLGSVAVVIAGLAHLRRLKLQRPPGLIYEEEEPGRIFEGFKLSEGLAAESPAASTSGRTRRSLDDPGGSPIDANYPASGRSFDHVP